MNSQSHTIRVGILGFGTVGQGTWKHLVENAQSLKKILGVEVLPTRASVRDLSKDRKLAINADALTDDSFSIVDDPSIDLILRTDRGHRGSQSLDPSGLCKWKVRCYRQQGSDLRAWGGTFFGSRKSRCSLRIRSECGRRHSHHQGFEESLVANEFPLIYGILNGTSNYILTRMENEEASFEDVLHDARELGYAEADESLDLDGVDAAHKAVILAYLAHGMWISLKDITVEGIRKISNEDLLAARKLGCKIKLIESFEEISRTITYRWAFIRRWFP